MVVEKWMCMSRQICFKNFFTPSSTTIKFVLKRSRLLYEALITYNRSINNDMTTARGGEY